MGAKDIRKVMLRGRTRGSGWASCLPPAIKLDVRQNHDHSTRIDPLGPGNGRGGFEARITQASPAPEAMV